MMSAFNIVKFGPEHLADAEGLSKSVGWPHRLSDWQLHLSLSKGVVAVENNKVIGTALRSDFGPDMSTINMVIVSETARGQGLGRRMVCAVMDPSAPRSYRLIATQAGRVLYEKLGFHALSYIRQHQGVLQSTASLRDDAKRASDAQPSDFAAIVGLESGAFGGDRSNLCSWLFDHAKNVITRNDAGFVTGYASRRAFGMGHVIGPVVASTYEDSCALISHLMQDVEGCFVRMDIAETSGLGAWLDRMGLVQVDRAPVMQTGATIIGSNRLAIFGQALG
jgi:predicted GNAT family acetyltransferase